MRIAIYILFLLMPIVANAQRIEIVWVEKESGEVVRVPNNQRLTTDEEKAQYTEYFALFAYGMPRAMVKTNDEMRASIYNFGDNDNPTYETGVTQRHHTTKGLDYEIADNTNNGGYNANEKISFGFLLAPHNVQEDGTTHEVGEHIVSEETLDWATASGWDSSLNTEDSYVDGYDYFDKRYEDRGLGHGKSTLNATRTGCAAYQGIDENDPQGAWRLPTQREIQVMFTIIEQALLLNGGTGENDENAISHIVDGTYWTSTEFCADQNKTDWQAFSMITSTGTSQNATKTNGYYARCVRDIYMDINEK